MYVVADNAQTTTTGYAAGSGVLPMASGYGAILAGKLSQVGYAGVPSSANPVVFSTFTADGVTCYGVYKASGVAADTLTGVSLLYGTDTTLASGCQVKFAWTAAHVKQLTDAAASFSGGVSAITLNTPGLLYQTPVNFSNNSGNWSATESLITQAPGLVLASPAVGSGTPSFLPLSTSHLPSGTTAGSGTLLVGTGSGYALGGLAVGSGLAAASGAGAISLGLAGCDGSGYGFPKDVTFLLGQGVDLANGTDLTGVGVLIGHAGKFVKWKCKAATNPAGGGFSFDVLRNGASIFSAPQAVAANTTAVQSGSAFATASVADGDELTINVSGAGTGVQNVNVTLYLLTGNS